MKTRITALLKALGEGVYEKDAELALGLLAALAGESMLLLGPPGVAKSMVARRLKLAFRDARSFEYLMSRFSTPDELFGPVSITRLKESDSYERAVDGYLPTADVVFLDEIWKAGPAIQNTLLTVINERTYLNGNRPMRVPLKLLVAASNELPTQGEGLEALWDRFLLRLVCSPIQDDESFFRMIAPSAEVAEPTPEASLPFTADEYEALRREALAVAVPQPVLHAIGQIRRALQDVAVNGEDVHRCLYVSDRRWKKVVSLLRTSSLLHDRQEVTLSDLQLAVHCLWTEPEEAESIGQIVADVIFASFQQRLDTYLQYVRHAMMRRRVREALDDALMRGDHRDDDLVIYDDQYYGLEDGHSFIPVCDFRQLPTRSADEPAVRGVMYHDPRQPQRTILRAFTNPDAIGEPEAELTRVNLYRDSRSLYVNGNRFALHRARAGEALRQVSGFEAKPEGALASLDDCETQVDALFVDAQRMATELRGHLFAVPMVQQSISGRMETFRKQIALLRADLRKLLYDE